MRLLHFVLSFLFTGPLYSITLYGSTLYGSTLYRTLETPFMQMNTECYRYSDEQYICSDIDMAIYVDPYSIVDVKFVCERSKINNFTIADFADFINTKFTNFGTPCSLFPINNLNSIQFTEHCPEMYEKMCYPRLNLTVVNLSYDRM